MKPTIEKTLRALDDVVSGASGLQLSLDIYSRAGLEATAVAFQETCSVTFAWSDREATVQFGTMSTSSSERAAIIGAFLNYALQSAVLSQRATAHS